MALTVNLNGSPYNIPEVGDSDWAANLSLYLQALATAFPQAAGSVGFTALTSATANPATTGQIRLAKSDGINFRNAGNSADDYIAHGNTAGFATDELYYIKGSPSTNTLVTGQAYAEYTTTAAQSIPSAAITVINFGTSVVDTDSAVTTGAGWKFTVPANKGGQYLVSANVVLGAAAITATATTFELIVQKNGSTYTAGPTLSLTPTVGVAFGLNVSTVVTAVAGDLINVALYQSNGGNRPLTASSSDNRISIKRLV